MRWNVAAGLTGLILILGSAPKAATLIPINQVKDGTDTIVFGINDQNLIAGAFKKGIHQLAFWGELNGHYEKLSKHYDLQARGIDNDGDILLLGSNGGTPCTEIQMERFADGDIKTIQKNRADLNGFPHGMNRKGQFVGAYCADSITKGYVGDNAKYRADIDVSVESNDIEAHGINGSGSVVGDYVDINTGAYRGFLVQNNVTSAVDYPDADNTRVWGLSDGGLAVGHWWNDGQPPHAFIFDSVAGTYTQIDVPGASYTEAFGLNNAGLVAIDSDAGPFIYCPKKKKCPGKGIEFKAHPVPRMAR